MTAVAALLLAALTVLPAPPRHLYVGEVPPWLAAHDDFVGGPSFATLAEALAAAADGDVVTVVAGPVVGPVRISRRVRVTGLAERQAPVALGEWTIAAAGVVIDRLTFRGPGAGLRVEGVGDVRIDRCRMLDSEGGCHLTGAERCVIERSTFSGCRAPVRIRGGGGHVVRGNVFESSGGYAVQVADSTGNVLQDNRLQRGSWVGVVLHGRSSDNRVTDNAIAGGAVGVAVESSGNLVRANTVTGAVHGILLGRGPLSRPPDEQATAVLFAHAPAVEENRVEENVVRACRREGILLRGACRNELARNRLHDNGAYGLVLLAGADANRVTANVFGPHPAGAAALVDCAGTVFRDNVLPDGHAIRVIDGGAHDLGDHPVERTVGAARASAAPEAPLGGGHRLLFGDLHTHSILSDGSCRPDEILRYGRDVVGLDFVGLSDHAEYLVENGRWEILDAASAAFHAPGAFVTFPGCEVTYLMRWEGHYNAYFLEEGARCPGPLDLLRMLPDLSVLTPFRLLDRLAAGGRDFLVVRHHYMATPSYWEQSPPDGPHLPMSEICSIHGSWTGQDAVDESRVARHREVSRDESTVAGGLRDGRVFALGGGSDTHYGFPGDFGLVAVLARAPTREAIFEAIRARRTYGTTGAPIVLGFAVDGQPMGATLEPEHPPQVEATVTGTADVEEAVLLAGETVVAQLAIAGRRAHLSMRLAEIPEPGTWLQLRVRQVDGETAWSTPIWFRPRPPGLAPESLLRDKERMSLLVAAVALRSWPHLPNPSLDGRTPAAAARDPAARERVQALWQRYEVVARLANEEAVALGLTTAAAAGAVVERFASRWTDLSPSLATLVAPLIDTAAVKRELGL